MNETKEQPDKAGHGEKVACIMDKVPIFLLVCTVVFCLAMTVMLVVLTVQAESTDDRIYGWMAVAFSVIVNGWIAYLAYDFSRYIKK